MKNAVKYCLLLLLVLQAGRAKASHIYGADFYYTHVTGNTYTLTLAIYGDCLGASFPNLSTGNAQVFVYNGSVQTHILSLTLQAPTTGVEVSAVCPAQILNTNCNGGTLPGVKKFTFSRTVNLGATSANWKFVFTGDLGTSTAGRSGSIGNIPSSTGIMVLEATLNNTIAPANSSPTYTTIPTPFFTQNKAASFNPGTVDINGDSLTYKLVNGLQSTSPTPFSYFNISYVFPYTATTPLSTVTNTFSFDTTNGQLDFTPDIVQNSLVVYKVSEYRNGVLVGTSMREMTFVVINGTNDPPAAVITGVQGGKRKTKTAVEACQGLINFNLNPSDANGDNITVSYTGLPTGATLTISGNGGTAPTSTFSWNASTIAPGTYTFFVTYADNGCPLKSTQTMAYSVIIVPPPTFSYALLSSATCIKKAAYRVTTSANVDTMKMQVIQSGVVIDSAANTTGIFNDSLVAGTYTIRVTNPTGCYHDTSITIDNPISTQFLATYDLATCNQYNDGAIYVTAISGTPPYQYALDAAPYGSSSSFTGLYSGSYIVHAKDANECIKDTVLTLDDSVRLSATVTATNVLCYQQDDGSITVSGAFSDYGGPYVYMLDGVTQSSNTMANLPPATYIVRAQDVKGCYITDTLTITEPAELVSQSVSNNISCHGANDGIISVSPTGGTPAYNFSINNGPYTTTPIFNGLAKGQYIVEVRDFNGCKNYDTLDIYEPNILSILNVNITHPNCFGSSDGIIDILGFGGTPPYTYSTRGISSTGPITGLNAGTSVVRITDNSGCTKDTNLTLTSPTRVYAGIGLKKATCATLANGMITISGNGGFSPYRYALGDTANFTAQTNYTPLAAGTYAMYVKDGHGCLADTNVVVQDSLYIYADALVSDVSCYSSADGGVMLAPAGGLAPYTVAFNNSSYSSNMSYTGYGAGAYPVLVKDAQGCIGDTTISISEPEILVADTDVVYNNCYGNALMSKIAVNVKGGTRPYTYTWSNGITGIDSVQTALTNGSYRVYVQDAKGCKDSVFALLEYHDCCTPFIPSAFTPNGDGKNDVFRLVSKGDIRLKELMIFNRYGQKIFISTDINDTWNGTFNGEPVDVGTYYYKLKAYCGNNNERLVEVKGDVTVVR